jgi:hypothetical protein
LCAVVCSLFQLAPRTNYYLIKLEPKTNIPTVEECPKGYPRLAAFLDSDENFMLYRRFGFLQSRILLHLQDELRELEDDLDLMDKRDQKRRPEMLKSRQDDDQDSHRRKEKISEIAKKFNEYGKIISVSRM